MPTTPPPSPRQQSRTPHSSQSRSHVSPRPRQNGSKKRSKREAASVAIDRSHQQEQRRQQLLSIFDDIYVPASTTDGSDQQAPVHDVLQGGGADAVGDWLLDLEDFEDDIMETDLMREVLQRGIDMRQYSKQVEDELHSVETASLHEYLDNREGFAELHDELQSCTHVLHKMRIMLESFQHIVDPLREDIAQLQVQSATMEQQLKNRRNVQVDISQFIDHVLVPPKMVHTICDGDVNGEYLQQVMQLNDKFGYIRWLKHRSRDYELDQLSSSTRPEDGSNIADDKSNSGEQSSNVAAVNVAHVRTATTTSSSSSSTNENGNHALHSLPNGDMATNASDDDHNLKYALSLACEDMEPIVEKLCSKAVTKIRQFLLHRISDLDKQKSNVTLIKHSSLLKFKHFNDFLRIHSQYDAYVEVKNAYQDVMSRYYLTNFRQYLTALLALERTLPYRPDVLVSTVSHNSPEASLLHIGSRGKLLDTVDLNDLIVCHVATQMNQRYFFEALFSSMNALLLNTATSEYLFLLDFFADSQQNSKDLFSDIFHQTFRTLVTAIDTQISNSVDIIGILIMIQRNKQYSQVMASRKIDVLESYLNELEAKLWPRFKQIFDDHIESLRNASSKQLAPRERENHTLSRNYATLACAIHVLNRESSYRQMLETNLHTLRQCMENKINTTVQFVSKGDANLAFLIQSYNAILLVFNSSSIPDSNPDKREIKSMLQTQISLLTESLLQKSFAKMIQFVRKTEPKISKSSSHDANRSQIPNAESEMLTLAEEFHRNWLTVIDYVVSRANTYFPKQRYGGLGTFIMQQTLAQLAFYHQRFTDIVNSCYVQAPFRNQMIGTQQLVVEIRNHTTANTTSSPRRSMSQRR